MAAGSEKSPAEDSKNGYPVWRGRSPGNFHLGRQPFHGFTVHIPLKVLHVDKLDKEQDEKAAVSAHASGKTDDKCEHKGVSLAKEGENDVDAAMETGECPELSAAISDVRSRDGSKAKDSQSPPHSRLRRSSRMRRPIPVKISRDLVERTIRRTMVMKHTRRYLQNRAKVADSPQQDFSSTEPSSKPPVFLHPAITPRFHKSQEPSDETIDNENTDVTKEASAPTLQRQETGRVDKAVAKPTTSFISAHFPRQPLKASLSHKLQHPASNPVLRKILQTAPTKTTWSPEICRPGIPPIAGVPVAPVMVPVQTSPSVHPHGPTQNICHLQKVNFVPIPVPKPAAAEQHFFPSVPRPTANSISSPLSEGSSVSSNGPSPAGVVSPTAQAYPVPRMLFRPAAGPSPKRAPTRAEWVRDQLLPPSPPPRQMPWYHPSGGNGPFPAVPIVIQGAVRPTNAPVSAPANQNLSSSCLAPAVQSPCSETPQIELQVKSSHERDCPSSTPNGMLGVQLPPLVPPSRSAFRARANMRNIAQLQAPSSSGGLPESRSLASSTMFPALSLSSRSFSSNFHQANTVVHISSSEEDVPQQASTAGSVHSSSGQRRGDKPAALSSHQRPGHHLTSNKEQQDLRAFRKRNAHLLQTLGWHAMQILIRKAREDKQVREEQELAESEPPPLISCPPAAKKTCQQT